MFVLDPKSTDLRFPPAELASPEGLLAIGGDLAAERLLAAYRQGVFPWYSDGQPILWWSPDPRAVLLPSGLKVSRSLRKVLRRAAYTVTLDLAFEVVMRACAAPRGRGRQGGTWITGAMIDAYARLHRLGHAHSVETWQEGRLVGGLYGVALGAAFFGESMFSHATDASKVALVHLVRQLAAWGFQLIDCQLPTAHLASLGAQAVARNEFLVRLARALERPDRRGPWRFDLERNIS